MTRPKKKSATAAITAQKLTAKTRDRNASALQMTENASREYVPVSATFRSLSSHYFPVLFVRTPTICTKIRRLAQ